MAATVQSARDMESRRRQEEETARERRARAQADLAGGSCGLALSGHAYDTYNGTYRVVDERDGWPVLQNEHGMWLFRVGSWARSLGDTGDSWRLSHEHTWDVDECNSYFISADGSLPVGDRSWHTIDGTTRLFAPRTMTMSVVVRAREHTSILGRTRPFHQLMRSWLAHCRRTTALELAH